MENATGSNTDETRHSSSTRAVVSFISKGRRKALWKMVRSLFLPTKIISTLTACGGTKKTRKHRRRIKRNIDAPLERPQPGTIPPPTSNDPSPNHGIQIGTDVVVENLQGLTISEPVPVCETGEYHYGANNEGQELDRNNCGSHDSSGLNMPTYGVEEVQVVRRRPKRDSEDTDKFLGWRNSSIEVKTEAPATLKWIPSGLQIGDKVIYLAEDQPERGVVRWIGRIREEFYAGVEFERPIGNSSGLYGYGGGLMVRLFQCDLGYGKFIPMDELVLYSDFYDKGVKAGFICIICRDDFLDIPDSEGDEGNMVATTCGHLYHAMCLDQWFAAKAKTRKEQCQGVSTQLPELPCPHCQKSIQYQDVIKLFPAQL